MGLRTDITKLQRSDGMLVESFFGVVGDGVKDCTLAVQTAIDALNAAGGGILRFPVGVFKITDELVLPNNGAPVILQGLGRQGATTLKWPSDLGAGKFAIKANDGGSTTYNAIRDIRILGPNPTAGLGVDPCSMFGVKCLSRMEVSGCNIQGFHGGIYLWGNHQNYTRCFINQNFYGVYGPASQPTNGNHNFMECDLTGNTMASVGCPTGGKIGGAAWVCSHMGFSPYGIYKEGGTNETFVTGNEWSGDSVIESVGNGGIFDNGLNGSCSDNLLPAGTFSDTFKIGANRQPGFYGAGNWNENEFDFSRLIGLPGFAPGNTCLIHCNGATASRHNTVKLCNQAFTVMAAAGKPFIICATVGTWTRYNSWYGCTGGQQGIFGRATEAIARADAVKWSNGNIARTTAGSKPLGVCEDLAAGSGSTITICTLGVSAAGFTAGSDCLNDQLIAPHGTTAGAMKAQAAGDYVLGIVTATNDGTASPGENGEVYINTYKT